MTTPHFQIPNPAGLQGGDFIQWNAATGKFDRVPSASVQLASFMNFGCVTLSTVAVGSILTPFSKEVISGAADTNKWIITRTAGTIRNITAAMRIAHTQDITFTINVDFAPTAILVTIPAGQTFGRNTALSLAVAQGEYITASAVAADALGAAFSMDVTVDFIPS